LRIILKLKLGNNEKKEAKRTRIDSISHQVSFGK
jgi:hypothetical protein